MGTWGPGIFDDDSALDFRASVMRELIDRVESFVKDGPDPDDFGDPLDRDVLPSIHILLTLCNEYGITRRLSVDRIIEWQSHIMVIFNKQYNEESSSSYVIKRRQVIEKLFSDLIVSKKKSLYE